MSLPAMGMFRFILGHHFILTDTQRQMVLVIGTTYKKRGILICRSPFWPSEATYIEQQSLNTHAGQVYMHPEKCA